MSNLDRRGERRRKQDECRRPRPASCQGPVQGRWGASEIGSSLAQFWSAEKLAGRLFAAIAVSFLPFSAKEETEKIQNARRSFPNRRRRERHRSNSKKRSCLGRNNLRGNPSRGSVPMWRELTKKHFFDIPPQVQMGGIKKLFLT